MVQALWYKTAVIYCLNVESFMDGDGDGIGDFKGLIRRLDYLHGLHVDAIWLMPFHPSPRRDHGYDVADYYAIDERFGTLGDFAEFTHECRQRGIRVMMDMVLNHTSDEHPWFQSARADPDSPYRDWYIWSDEKPDHAHQGMMFPGEEDSTWTYDRKARKWYFHRFYHFQPDLDMANPAVQEEMLKVIGFWTQMGVSGFRLDAVPFVVDAKDHTPHEQEQEYHLLRRIREFTQFRRGDCVLLAEANVPVKENRHYFGEEGQRLQMMFNFQANASLFYALAAGDKRPLAKALEQSRELPTGAQWCYFLRNHDELNLSQLTEAQREKVFEEFAPDEEMRIYDRGIRRRLPPMLKGDRRRIELATSLLMSLPGTAVLRYGEEIGMGDDLSLPERAAVRTPMQWDDSAHAGFTAADNPFCPPIAEGPYSFDRVNVADQQREPDSLLNWTERIMRLRKATPEIGHGDYELVEAPDDVLALLYRWRGVSVLTVHSFCDRPREIEIALPGEASGTRLVDLLGNRHVEPEGDRHRLVLDPYGYRWFRIGEADPEVRRREA